MLQRCFVAYIGHISGQVGSSGEIHMPVDRGFGLGPWKFCLILLCFEIFRDFLGPKTSQNWPNMAKSWARQRVTGNLPKMAEKKAKKNGRVGSLWHGLRRKKLDIFRV